MILNNDWPRGKKTLQLKILGKQELIIQPHGLGLHPAQLYETMSMILLLFLLLSFEPFQTKVGQLTAILMMCYAMHRFLNELLRSDPRPVSLESNVSVFLFLAGLLLLGWIQWKGTIIKRQESSQTLTESHPA
jgi:prolipoprotein diacylglyceryltransferase